ncbi:MAG: hypothetical protein HQK59_07915 [Deltaproteobacteria bacterium]|nr:hypothetical protein [Deltaproteobacteria bacterium]
MSILISNSLGGTRLTALDMANILGLIQHRDEAYKTRKQEGNKAVK